MRIKNESNSEINVKIAGVVLAGGQSQRMGADKAHLTINQNSLLSHAVNLLQRSGFSDCFVSGNYPEFNCIVDQKSELGPIAGLAACASFLYQKYDAMFVIPIDMPLLIPEDCTHLVDLYEVQKNNGCAGYYYKNAIFPILITLSESLVDYLTNMLNTSDKKTRSLFRLFETLDIKGIELNAMARYRFENTNTPTEWENCLITYEKLRKQKLN